MLRILLARVRTKRKDSSWESKSDYLPQVLQTLIDQQAEKKE
jgi:hypothetical protein